MQDTGTINELNRVDHAFGWTRIRQDSGIIEGDASHRVLLVEQGIRGTTGIWKDGIGTTYTVFDFSSRRKNPRTKTFSSADPAMKQYAAWLYELKGEA